VAPDTINEAEILSLVSQNAGLENKLYEFTKEVGNGKSVLEAVASMANDVGGLK